MALLRPGNLVPQVRTVLWSVLTRRLLLHDYHAMIVIRASLFLAILNTDHAVFSLYHGHTLSLSLSITQFLTHTHYLSHSLSLPLSLSLTLSPDACRMAGSCGNSSVFYQYLRRYNIILSIHTLHCSQLLVQLYSFLRLIVSLSPSSRSWTYYEFILVFITNWSKTNITISININIKTQI